MKKLWGFLIDLWRDGSGLIAAIAAPLSIAFTVAKALDLEALGNLREISYAWAFAPLTVWLFSAYVRRRAFSREIEGRLIPTIKLVSLRQFVSNYETFGRTVELEIQNDSAIELPNCLVKVTNLSLTRVMGETGKLDDITEVYMRDLPIALRTKANIGRHGGGPFHLRPNESKRIPLCTRADGAYSPLLIHYEEVPTPHVGNVPNFHAGFIEVTIFVASTPSARRIELHVNERSELVASLISTLNQDH